ncbi:MAG: Glu/Leu/Phe/Val dehydrogenase dimerization domain-containing protein [Rhodovibrionaceae bacterium]|nr:Glu/Leu/Phe/Val dehydrogenase dimerization domain-containing protein [Rhodovibrionaceae bacterium]
MPVFSNSEFDTHEQVVFCHDAESGLKAIIAIHNTSRGGALGGCRMWAYKHEDEALTDALRLSRGMTYKSAMADLPYGGGKSVIIGNPKTDKSEALFRALGRYVESLAGRYVIAEDVGIGVEDVETMAKETDHVAGVRNGGAGDPSPGTAYGVFMGLRAAVQHKLGRDSLEGLTVAVQGLGHVGNHLCRYLHEAGAKLVVADIDAERLAKAAEEFGAETVDPNEILFTQCDVVAPCALGAVIDDDTVPRIQAPVIAGAANNQLAEPRHGAALRERGILYAPDYVINAGGIINISYEKQQTGRPYDKEAAFAHIGRIYDPLLEIFRRADRQDIPTSEASDRIAEERFRKPTKQAA